MNYVFNLKDRTSKNGLIMGYKRGVGLGLTNGPVNIDDLVGFKVFSYIVEVLDMDYFIRTGEDTIAVETMRFKEFNKSDYDNIDALVSPVGTIESFTFRQISGQLLVKFDIKIKQPFRRFIDG